MNWKKIANRIRGFSLGGFGAEWEPPQLEQDIAQSVITFLEDRRVLFNPYPLEEGNQCIESVLEIRKFLTGVLQGLPNKPGLAQHLRVLRGACRSFLDAVHAESRHRPHLALYQGGKEAQDFFIALGELRRSFGIHLGLIAATYHIGLEGDLATILPASDDDSPHES